MISKLYFSKSIKSNQSLFFFYSKRNTEKIVLKRLHRILPCGSTRLAFATRLNWNETKTF